MAPRKASKQKDPNAPKKPQTSYFLFLADYRQRHLGEKGTLVQEAASAWKAMSDKEKQVWKDRAEEDKKRFAREKAESKSSK